MRLYIPPMLLQIHCACCYSYIVHKLASWDSIGCALLVLTSDSTSDRDADS